MATDYSNTPPIEPGYYWLSPRSDGHCDAPEIGLLTRSKAWLLSGDDERWTSEAILGAHGRQFGPRIHYLCQPQSEDTQRCPGCLSRQQTVSMLRSDLNIANREYKQLLDLNSDLENRLMAMSEKLVDAIHWRDQYRRELETIRRGVDTTQMGE